VATIWHSAPEKKGCLRSTGASAWNFRVNGGTRLRKALKPQAVNGIFDDFQPAGASRPPAAFEHAGEVERDACHYRIRAG